MYAISGWSKKEPQSYIIQLAPKPKLEGMLLERREVHSHVFWGIYSQLSLMKLSVFSLPGGCFLSSTNKGQGFGIRCGQRLRPHLRILHRSTFTACSARYRKIPLNCTVLTLSKPSSCSTSLPRTTIAFVITGLRSQRLSLSRMYLSEERMLYSQCSVIV